MTFIPRVTSLLLTILLLFGPASAQTSIAPSSASFDAGMSEGLQLRVVGGKSPAGATGSRALEAFLIEVTGSNGAAVPDAAVAFRLPDADPTGRFADGTHAAVAYTDQMGRAKIEGIHWNAAPGTVAIRIAATKGTLHAGLLIEQTLVAQGIGALAHPVLQTSMAALPLTTTSLPISAPIDMQPRAIVIAPGQPASATPPVAPRTPPQDREPAVSVTSASPGESKHSSKTKWIILAAVAAAGAGAGIAMMGKKSSAAPPSGSGISIGPPTVNVGGGH